MLNLVDTNESNKCDIDFGVVCNSFNMDHYDLNSSIYDSSVSHPLKCYWLKKTLCTDTWVGIRVYVFAGTVVGYSNQDARKSTEFITWKNEKTKNVVGDWLLTLIDKNEWDIGEVFFDDEDYVSESVENGYRLWYCSQLLESNVLYKNTVCDVIKKCELHVNVLSYKINTVLGVKSPKYIDALTIKYSGHYINVNISEVLVPWNIQ